MNAQDFYNTVVQLRVWQRKLKTYPQDREAASTAKYYERKIDEEIKRVELVTREHRQLRLDL